MSKANGKLGSAKGTSTLVRARFGPGMLLQHEDLEQLSSYTRDLSRLLFKSLFGCGVICGLRVTTTPHCGSIKVTVDAGVALACSGDPVHVPADQSFQLDESCDPLIAERLWVVLCGTVKCCAPRTAICSDEDDGHSECTRERDGFAIRLVSEPPKCVCHCPEPEGSYVEGKKSEFQCVDPNLECYKNHYEGICGCNCDECSDCDCKCILLARLDKKKEDEWIVDHRVRRFIRPVLMRDPPFKPEEADEEHAPPKVDSQTAAEFEKQVEERLAKMAEEKKLIEEQLAKMADEKRQIEEQLTKMVAEKMKDGPKKSTK